jgi:6-phospho 3-hexuloisomerase
MDNAVDISLDILKELEGSLSKIDRQQAKAFEDAVITARKVFVAGAGRSLLMVRGLAMRLMHMGFEAYVVGETVTPAIGPEDLLIIGSGSGETGTLTVMANKAKKVGAMVALITIYPMSTIGHIADFVVQINAATTKGDRDSVKSVQPGANMFEQSLLLFCDATMISIINRCNISDSNTALMKRHANLE